MPSGNAVVNLSIATNRKFKNQDSGSYEDKTEWHRVVYFGKLAEIAEQYLDKGSKVYVEGKLQTRKWQDQSGADRYTTEIVGNDLTMLDSRNSDGSGGASQSPSTPAEDVNQEPQYSEDDIPF